MALQNTEIQQLEKLNAAMDQISLEQQKVFFFIFGEFISANPYVDPQIELQRSTALVNKFLDQQKMQEKLAVNN